MSSKKKTSVLIITAGQSRSGKSTALNNIFGTDFKSKCSASSVTRSVDVRRCVDGHEEEVIVVDTPGLAATDIKLKEVKKQLLEAIGGLNFVLLYCFSVGPNSSHNVADENVVKNLTKILGKEIWKKCVVLFTSSDTVRRDEFPRREHRDQYKKYIDDQANRFNQLLRRNCGSDLHVKSVFNIDINADKIEEIVAIPVGKELRQGDEDRKLTPGMEINWMELASCLIIKKAEPMDRGVYLRCMKIETYVGTAAGAALGIALGIVITGTTGIVIGVELGRLIGWAVKKKLENKVDNKIHQLHQAKHIAGTSDECNPSIQNDNKIATSTESYDIIESMEYQRPSEDTASIPISSQAASQRDPEDPENPEEPVDPVEPVDLVQSIMNTETGGKFTEFTGSFDPEKPDLTPYEEMT